MIGRPVRVRVVSPITAEGFRQPGDLAALGHEGLVVDGSQIASGPASIESEFEVATCVPDTIARIIEAEREGIDAVVIDCMADPALRPAREMVRIPVVGPSQAAMHVAAMLGHRFSVVTVMRRLRAQFENAAAIHGLASRMASVRHVDIPVLELEADLDATKAALVEEAQRAVEVDGAEAVIFGCTGLLGCAASVRDGLLAHGIDIPIIDPIPTAVSIAAALVRSNLTHSPLTFPKPPRKTLLGYDLLKPAFSVAAECRLVEKGYRQGGMAGYGLRRLLIDENGEPKAELAIGERKSLQTDRVILVPGPQEEVEVVRRIYGIFVELGLGEAEIAARLNREGILTDLGRPWTRGTVHQVLTNPKYIGDNVFNRVSFKLKMRRVVNTREHWVRACGAFAAIVDADVFERTAKIVEERSQRLSDDELLDLLRSLLKAQGSFSSIVIDEREDMPSSSVYRNRFGSLLRAYRLVGYSPERDYRYVEINRRLRAMHPDVVAAVIDGLRAAGGDVHVDPATGLIDINGEFTASVVIARCGETRGASPRWRIRLDVGLVPDITVAIRMGRNNLAPLDYYLLPRLDMTEPKLRLAENNGLSLDGYRFETLDFLFSLAARAPFKEAA